MAASGRFDLSLSRPDGPTYVTGQRGSYAAAHLEKSGSFREGSDRIFPSHHSTPKSATVTSQGDMAFLLQSLASDLKGVSPDSKLNRPGEMKRAMSSIFGLSTELSLSSTSVTRAFPSSSFDEIKRLKSNLQEGSTKARDRAKAFDVACSMIDKFWHIKRKRSRLGYSSNLRTAGIYQGGNIPKTAPQSHPSGNGLEDGSQREEKSKLGVPNKRIRTSLLEMDALNSASRFSGPLERDKDIVKSINGSTTQLHEKDGSVSAVGDGWERSKLKKKRSIIKSDVSSNSALARVQEEREVKRGIQPKFGIEARPRMNLPHSFRPGSDSSTTVVGSSDISLKQHAPIIRTRNELNSCSLLNDKRDVRFSPDTESSSLKVINKPNSREDKRPASSSFFKFGSSRTRSNSGSLLKTSSNSHQVVGNSEDMDLPLAIEKQDGLGANNRKRAASVRSLSPPVGQWTVQKQKKFCRSSRRRSSLSPHISSHDDLGLSETVDETSVHYDDIGESKQTSLNASQQSRVRGENFPSASLSESEDSGVQEKKLKYKAKKSAEREDKIVLTVHKSANLVMPLRKNRMAIEEDGADGDRRQGRLSGRGFIPTRSGLSATIEKLSETVTAKQQRSVRHASESKQDRPPIRKLSERKICTRPRQSISVLSMESSEEAADDQEELVAAATAAIDTGRACSNSFWKQLESVFRFVSLEDTAFLLEQVDQENVSTLSEPATNTCKSTVLPYGTSFYECDTHRGFTKESGLTDPLLYSGVSICQALLSAIIGEEDLENIYCNADYGEGYSYEDAAHFELDRGLKSKVLNLQPLEDSYTAKKTSDCCKIGANWQFCDDISNGKSRANGMLETYNKLTSSVQQTIRQTSPFNTTFTEFQYNQMSINDRLILELNEIGLYPEIEAVPDLTYGEDEDITRSISMLEEKLHEQAANRQYLLLELKAAILNAKELQQRRLERLALNHLVQIAYDRYMACWGPNASGIKNANKIAKHSTMGFVRRTLARVKMFEETGISCFNQPIFRDIFLSASSLNSDSQNAKGSSGDGLEKKEAFLDNVAKSFVVPSVATPSLENSLTSGGVKGKRSERERDAPFKNSTTKGERRSRSKPKVKMTQPSKTGTKIETTFPLKKNDDPIPFRDRPGTKKLTNDGNTTDLSHIQLADIDVGDLVGQGQDIASWLNFEDEGLQDHGEDFMGLEIPMDDLSDVHMMI